ncbi:MAG: ATP-binding protein, partial [Bacteroidaceae bacterium]|nr:ATP-binding protein [Bacteroidaceae bacterium]
DRHITVSRAKYTIDYPANFMMVASMNPCPCGYYTHPTRPCICSPTQVQRYLGKISGPLMDRFDLQVEISPVPFEKLSEKQQAEPSAVIRERVIRAREIQTERFRSEKGIHCNAQMTRKQLEKYAMPDKEGLSVLQLAMERLNLSARAYDRILKVARTIADLEGCEQITSDHIGEAIGYRSLDRENWVS